MKKVTHAWVVAGMLVGSLSLGLGATPAVAAPLSTSSTGFASGTLAAPVRSVSTQVQNVQVPTTVPQPQDSSRAGIPIGPIVALLKKAGAAIWNACVKAVKAGWSRTVAWWNSLAPAIRTAIKWLTSASAEEILRQIISWVVNH